MKRMSLLAVTLILPSVASAEMRLDQYREFAKAPEVNEKLSDYITGVGRGIFWANAVLDAQEKQKLFCLPPELGLDEAIIQSLLKQEIDNPKATYPDDTPIELIIVKAFTRHFPCKK